MGAQSEAYEGISNFWAVAVYYEEEMAEALARELNLRVDRLIAETSEDDRGRPQFRPRYEKLLTDLQHHDPKINCRPNVASTGLEYRVLVSDIRAPHE